jgi:glutamyl/glutaminyl-tRNA synthetase
MAQTRIAPTPSGFLHLGNVYAFVKTAALAQQHGLELRLRIDDLDRSRFRLAYLNDIFEVLQLLEIGFDHGPRSTADFEAHYRQELRLPLYQGYLQELRDQNLVYACQCSRGQAGAQNNYPGNCRHQRHSLNNPNHLWRVRVAPEAKVRLRDWQGGERWVRVADYTGDFVVQRRAERHGMLPMPSYQLACVADDVLYQTTHIVRGMDLLESSVAQLYLAQLLGLSEFEKLHFEHHALLTLANGIKLSKSAGDRHGQSLLNSYHDRTSLLAALNDWNYSQ